ncbi:MAG: ABC transporter permease [Chloroflexi bacterium]|nr:ABC transporter permease [Chloroflexota bacterium]MDA1148293.1 ABC transporter permease [Chloroflexota bacterium]
MVEFIVRRLLQTLPVLLITSIAVFMVVRLIPGDPASLLAGEDPPPGTYERIREELGLDDPWIVQYVDWVSGVVTGDFGTSFRTKFTVSKLLKLSLPPSLELALASYTFALLVGIPLGVMAGARPRSLWDWGLSFFTMTTIGIPNFLLGIVLLWIFSVSLGWFPVAGRVSVIEDPIASLQALALPALTLGSGQAAVLARYTRTSVQETMGRDYIRTARAKGLTDRVVIFRHGLRNALIPVVTIAALQVGGLLSGVVIIESVFTRPGLGRTIVEAIQNRDYLVIQGMLLFLVTVFIVVNLMADLAYGFLDPRLRRGSNA